MRRFDGEVSSLKEQTKELSVKTEETKEHTIDELTDLAINKMNKIVSFLKKLLNFTLFTKTQTKI